MLADAGRLFSLMQSCPRFRPVVPVAKYIDGGLFVRPDHLADLERAIAQALTKVRELSAQNALPPVLQPLNLIAPPRGFHVQVELRPYTDHAREDDWNRDPRWDPRNGEISIGYEPARDEGARDDRSWYADDGRAAPTAGPADTQTALRDVVAVVARAENDPSFKFLALKFLRDQLLPRHVAWGSLPHEAQIQINYAIDQRVLLTGKVENPRSPQYPVTTVQLNREHDLVKEVLGATDGASATSARATDGTAGSNGPLADDGAPESDSEPG
jgi:hypothetical protein